MDLPTYTNIWRIEKRLYKLYDFRLPMPLPVGQIAVFAAIAVPYVVVLELVGLPFSHTLLWIYVLPPGVMAWLVTRPVLESKRLPELVVSQVRYLVEPRTWCRMAPFTEKDEITIVARVWRRYDDSQARRELAPVVIAPALAPGELVGYEPADGDLVDRELVDRELADGDLDDWQRGSGLVAAGEAPAPAAQAPARTRREARRAARAGLRAPVAPVPPPPARPASPPPQIQQPQIQPQIQPQSPRPPAPARGWPEVAAPSRHSVARRGPARPAAFSRLPGTTPAAPGMPVAPGTPVTSAGSGSPAAPVVPDAPVTPAGPVTPPTRQVPDRVARAVPAPPATAPPAPAVRPLTPAAPVPPAATPPVTVPPAATSARPVTPVASAPPAPYAPSDPPATPNATKAPAEAAASAEAAAPEAAAAAGTAAPPAAATPPAPPPKAKPVVTVTGDQHSERPMRMVERALGSRAQRRTTGWTDHVVVVPGGHRPGRPDQLQRDRARARLAVPGGHRIVVLGCTVGAGQTVTTLLTGEILASLRDDDQVAVLDLNPGPGSLAERARAVPALNPAQPAAPSRLEVVTREAAGDPGAQDDATKIFELLSARYPLTLADPGAASVPRVLAAASQLIMVAPASQDAASALATTREWLEAHGHAELANGAITVLNGVSRHTMAHVEQAEALARGRCRAIVRVPWDDHLRKPEPQRGSPAPVGNPSAPPPGPLSPPALQAYTALAGVLVAALAGTAPEQMRARP